jgi:hypothetical protein
VKTRWFEKFFHSLSSKYVNKHFTTVLKECFTLITFFLFFDYFIFCLLIICTISVAYSPGMLWTLSLCYFEWFFRMQPACWNVKLYLNSYFGSLINDSLIATWGQLQFIGSTNHVRNGFRKVFFILTFCVEYLNKLREENNCDLWFF